jgi:hypothetical protein
MYRAGGGWNSIPGVSGLSQYVCVIRDGIHPRIWEIRKMKITRLALAGALAAAGLSLGACATDGYYGGGYGSGYYGYSGYYDDGYYDYYGPSYYGWYGNYYYPGTGIYVYDRNHRRHRWSNSQRDYWRHRGSQWRGDRPRSGNWDRFNHRSGTRGNDRGQHWRGGGDHHRGSHANRGDHRGGSRSDSGRHHWRSGQGASNHQRARPARQNHQRATTDGRRHGHQPRGDRR